MPAKRSSFRPAIRAVLVGVVFAALAGCTASYRNHGYIPPKEELDAIKVGVDTRTTVAEAVGAPGSTGVLDDSGFYYVATRVRHFGMREPKVVSREMVAISFDRSGVVRNIERFSLEDGRVIPLDRRVTSSSVQDKTFLRQLLGNLGRFNPSTVLDQ